MGAIRLRGLGALPFEFRHMSKEQIFPASRDRYLLTVKHFNVTSILADKLLYKFQIDQMRIVSTEEIPVAKEILEFLQMPRNKYFSVSGKKKP